MITTAVAAIFLTFQPVRHYLAHTWLYVYSINTPALVLCLTFSTAFAYIMCLVSDLSVPVINQILLEKCGISFKSPPAALLLLILLFLFTGKLQITLGTRQANFELLDQRFAKIRCPCAPKQRRQGSEGFC